MEMFDTTIHKITLVFPHGISSEQGDMIAQYAQDFSGCGIVEGGMEVLAGSPNSEEMIFAKDAMSYTYGPLREPKNHENRPKVGKHE